jgi:uncharacterized ion transporter superfamily protein YfcC
MARFHVPHTLVLLFGMIVLAYGLTWVLPQGEFETFEVHGKEQVVPGTYKTLDTPEQLSPLVVFTVIPKGFEKVAEIIFFVFIVGGAFGVLRATGAIDAMIGVLLPFLARRSWLFIVGSITLFALGSSTIGMAEEYLPFVPILLALAIGLGFDSITAIGVLCIGYAVGYGSAILNPFTVMVAQNVAGVQPTSGMAYRLVLSVVFLLVGFHHVWSYAQKVKADPSKSLVADIAVDPELSKQEHPAFTFMHGMIILTTAAAMVLVVYGLSQASGWEWYVKELGAVFLALSLLLALVARLGPSDAAQAFCTGAGELTTTALLIGFANSILLILEDGHIIHTIVNAVSQPLTSVGTAGAAVGMFFFQSICNFFIPSGSGQAYVTMPIMAPLADLAGIHRQVAVLAYQFGDGFTNILVPTNAVLIGILTMARIPYDRWLRFVLPFMLKIWVVGSIALVVAVSIGYK